MRQIGYFYSDWYIFGIDGKLNNEKIWQTKKGLQYREPESRTETVFGLGFSYLREHGFSECPELYGMEFGDLEWWKKRKYPDDFYVEMYINNPFKDVFHSTFQRIQVHPWSGLRKVTWWVTDTKEYSIEYLAKTLPHEDFIQYLKDSGIYIVKEKNATL